MQRHLVVPVLQFQHPEDALLLLLFVYAKSTRVWALHIPSSQPDQVPQSTAMTQTIPIESPMTK